MKINYTKVSKEHWYATGGFSNPTHFRKHNGRCWEYYIEIT